MRRTCRHPAVIVTIAAACTSTAFTQTGGMALVGAVQQPQATTGTLTELVDVLRSSNPEHAAIYSLTYNYNRYQPRNGEQVVSDLTFLATGYPPNEATKYARYAFVTAYRDALTQTFSKFRAQAFATGTDVPLQLATHRGQAVVIIEGLVSENVFNTLRTTSRSRAVSVATALVLPSLKRIDPLCNLPAIGFVAIQGVYGSRSFLDKSEKPEAETLTVVVLAAACRDFIAGRVSEDDLIAGADVFLTDRDAVLETRKIKLSLQ